jgi:hypothetical protein
VGKGSGSGRSALGLALAAGLQLIDLSGSRGTLSPHCWGTGLPYGSPIS